MNRQRPLLSFGCTLVIVLASAFASAVAQEKKPNIVFILVDNIGWSNFQVYGGTVPTPRIDKLASEGIRFNNYNVEVQCTPSRSAIMTGRHPVRSGTYTVPLPGQGLVVFVSFSASEVDRKANYEVECENRSDISHGGRTV